MTDEIETREGDPVETAKDELRAEAERVAEAEAIAHAEGVAEAEAEAARASEREDFFRACREHDAALVELREKLAARIDESDARISELQSRLDAFEDEAPEIAAASELAAVDVAEAVAAEMPPEHVEESEAHHGKRKFVGLFRE